VEHFINIVPDSAPWAFGFAKHEMGIGGRELYPNAEAGEHLAGDSNFKHRVQVESYDWCERAELGVMACMQVLNVQQDGF
jgi:hypothetical protein